MRAYLFLLLLNVVYFYVIFHVESLQHIDERFRESGRDHDVGRKVNITRLCPEIVNIASLIVELHQNIKRNPVFGFHLVDLVSVTCRQQSIEFQVAVGFFKYSFAYPS